MPKKISLNQIQQKLFLLSLVILTGLLGLALLGSPQSALAADDLGAIEKRQGEDSCRYKPAKGIATVVSDNTFDVTLENVRAEINARPLGIFGEVDHQANATNVGLELRPTTTIIFGNPNIGTQLMQSNQAIGLELPLKMLVWEDACGVVRIDYNKPSFLQSRFKIGDLDALFGNVSNVLNAIATGAAAEGPDPYP